MSPLSNPDLHREIVAFYTKLDHIRHACEVRFVASWALEGGMPDYPRMSSYFTSVEQYRGIEIAARLKEDVRTELKRRRRAKQEGSR